MGHRRKLLFRAGTLSDALTGEVLRAWPDAAERIIPDKYRVELNLASGGAVVITEDEDGVWLEQGGRPDCLTAAPVQLPRFEGHPHAALLRILHHELLVNVMPHGPVPNFFVYPKPWYRDAAMVAMCLERTGNVGLLRDWILGLRDPFDHNNGGRSEPDNLGQALYLISLVADASHPLVEAVLGAIGQFAQGWHIMGITDGAEHPVYQTKWLKFGLRSLGQEDPWEIPAVRDSYSSLFWWDFKEAHVPGPRFGENGDWQPVSGRIETGACPHFPYLNWAEAHFYGEPPPLHLLGTDYPLTWEAHASEAQYAGTAPLGPEYVARRLCAPHTWHAAEAFLYLLG